MILQIAPDGQAVVGGPQLDLPVDKLMTLASGQVKELGETHGLRGPICATAASFRCFTSRLTVGRPLPG